MEALAARLAVSEATIRRDLAQLAAAGLVQRIHGGAAPVPDTEVDRPFAEVADEAAAAKRSIGRRAAELVEDGDVVLLDIGTTTEALARELRERPVTVITPSLAVLDALRDDPTVDLILLGGALRRRYHSLVGPLTEDSLRQIRARTVFLGTSGVSPTGDILDTTSVEIGTKRALLASADHVVLLADHSKFPGTGVLRVTDLHAVDQLVTDQPVEHMAAVAEDSRCEIIIA